MDVGKKFVAFVDDPETDEEARRIYEQDIKYRKQTPTEDMSIPFSIYLVE